MPLETESKTIVPKNYVPPNSERYKVTDGDSWEKFAKQIGINTWDLIVFNFKTKDPQEVNWYLHHYFDFLSNNFDIEAEDLAFL